MGIVRELKSNLDAAWNTEGNKFCVGSSSGFVYVGTYQDQQNFWVAHPMKKDKPTHKASVVCTRFDPQAGRVIASCSLDGNILMRTWVYNLFTEKLFWCHVQKINE